jgi:hypothetical protein
MSSTTTDKLQAWLQLVSSTESAHLDPKSVGYPSDALLRKIISRHVGKNCPSNAVVAREQLCADAVRLNLVLEAEAALSRPRTKVDVKWAFFDAVNKAGPIGRVSEALEEDEWIDNDDLVKLIKYRVNEDAPEHLPRIELLKMAVYIGAISDRQAAIPRPAYKMFDELDLLWTEHQDAKKREWDAGQNALVASSVKEIQEAAAAAAAASEGRLKQKKQKAYKAKRFLQPRRPKDRKQMIQACFELGLVSKSDLKSKVIRQDKADKAATAKSAQEVTRTTSMTAMFKGLPNATALKAAIADISDKLSELVYQRGFLVWLHLHRLISDGIDLPALRGKHLANFVRRCFMVGTKGSVSDKKDPEILKTLQQYKGILPDLDRPLLHRPRHGCLSSQALCVFQAV